MPTPPPPVTSDLRSLAESLDAELQNYSGLMKEAKHFKGFPSLECEEAPLPWSKAADRLCQKQTCPEDIKHYVDEDNRSKMETLAKNMRTLNGDLVQHLGVDSCPGPSSTSRPVLAPGHPDLPSVLLQLLQCISCWRQQVKAAAQQRPGSAP